MENRNIYKGHRYVPKVMGEWDNQETYEGLSIVTDQGTSYTSKKRVPVGVDILDEEYWVVTGNYNAQIEHYRQDVRDMQENVNEKMDQTVEYVDGELLSVTSKLAETMINGKDFGLTGEEGTNSTELLQDFFDYAKSIGAKTVIVPEGTHIVDSNGVTYEVSNSTLIFEGTIKFKDYGTQLSGTVVNFRADNLIVKNFRIDGDRNNNIIAPESGRGTQFNFGSYARNNITFEGGSSINALQCSFQSTSNMTFKDFSFENAGEHHAYLTSANGQKGADYMEFFNCTFKNWALDMSGAGISGRDYFFIHAKNCKMEIENNILTEQAFYIASRTHRDLISNPKDKHHLYEGLYCVGSTYYRNISSSDPIPVTIRDSYIEGYIYSGEGSDEMYIENSKIVGHDKYATTEYPADKYFNCELRGGRIWSNKKFEMHNSHVYCDENTNEGYISLHNVPEGESTIINNVCFEGFGEFFDGDANGILRSKEGSENRNIFTNNRFVKCGTSRGIIRINERDFVSGNNDIDGEGVRMLGSDLNEFVTNNSLVDARG